MLRWTPGPVVPELNSLLWHFANGALPCYASKDKRTIKFLKYTHRGVQFLDKLDFPRKQKRYIFSPKFEIRFNTAFEEVLKGCASLEREGVTWISPELYEGYMVMHRAGFAHSYECWENNQLVGGAFGIQIGGYISCESMFHRVSNASKAAWGQTCLHLQKRGFTWVDTNCVAAHLVNFGEEWVPQWKFEQMVAEELDRRVPFLDGSPTPSLPKSIKLRLPLGRVEQKVLNRLPFPSLKPAFAPAPATDAPASPPPAKTQEHPAEAHEPTPVETR